MQPSKIGIINIQDIHPAEYNPRIMPEDEYNKLKNSLDTFGLVDPIIIDLKHDNTIIGGHQRYEVLNDNDDEQELTLIKLGDIGLIIKDENIKIHDINDQKALNLALNKISGEWDYSKLDDLLIELNDDHYDIELTGFDTKDILIEDSITLEDTNMEDNVETLYEVPNEIKTKIKKGDKYQLGKHTLLCGDASNKKDIQELIQDNKIDIILTDPPYGMGLNTDYSPLKSTPKFSKEKKVRGGNYYPAGSIDTFNPKFISNILELNIKETFLFGANYFTDLLPINDGSWIVWDKRSDDGTPIEKAVKMDKMYGSCFELLWSKNKHKQDIIRVKWAGIFGTEKEFGKHRYHPTQKPIRLFKWILDKYAKQGNNVLDLFGGAGGTLLASEDNKCNCYMMEIDPYYCQIIINRWEEYTGQKAKKINLLENEE